MLEESWKLEEKINAAEEKGNVRKLAARLKLALELLRDKNSAVRLRKAQSAWEQWLIDNFYALEGHAKQTLRELKGLMKKSESLYTFYDMLESVFCDGKAPLTQECVCEAMRLINEKISVTERMFDFLTPALKTVLLLTAAFACDGEKTDSQRETLISYAVVGLGNILQLDTDIIVRTVSGVEKILTLDPTNDYKNMAEESRRHYRHIAARIAVHCGISETQVAKDVLSCAKNGTSERRRHVGYYLMRHDPLTVHTRRRGMFVLLSVTIISIVLCVVFGIWSGSLLASLAVFIPTTELVRIPIMRLSTRAFPVGHIPRMDGKGKMPSTAIVISTLLPEAENVGSLRVRLEQLYFSNRADYLSFCLLADFKEERRPFNPRDERNLQAARQIVEELNEKYGERFAIFVRRRSFCTTQNAYCGWERKRGAIIEFIRFIKGNETSVCCFVGNKTRIAGAKYLLALDSDTNLSFDCANVLVAAAAHPLNKPMTGKNGRIVEGYGILTARISPALEDKGATHFSRLFAGTGGVASYEQECGDFYQDLFGDAIFTGKGLLNIDVFSTLTSRLFPENAVLSHDILEGACLRTGLLSDVEMTDSEPENVMAWLARLHRWTRGDWQNLRFIGRRFHVGGKQRKNPIGMLSRVKLLDNIRRSLITPTCLICVIMSAFLTWKIGLCLLAISILAVAGAPIFEAMSLLLRGGWFALTRRYFSHTLPRALELLGRAGMQIIMLAQQALVMTDAILRTLWRLIFSKKNLLQWTTAAQAQERKITFRGILRKSRLSFFIGFMLMLLPVFPSLPQILGFLFICYIPAALYSSHTSFSKTKMLSEKQCRQILSWCAQMLGYYETYANKKNHWLPPDNVQYSPVETVARRTSPTNIGMMLVSYLSARDMGLIDSAALCVRLTRTLDTIDKLQTYEGNLYNWYATDDLRILPTPFVSAVDSGNYLCALVTLREGVREFFAEEPKLKLVYARLTKILDGTNFSIFYDETRKLLTIGIDENGNKSSSHYDFLMSEARTASYYAVATRQVPCKHWRALNRGMSREGPYAGPVSWTGTMFEYYMPHLFIPAYENSLLGEALHYAFHCQKRRVHNAVFSHMPWGISESGYFAFDEQLNYQYRAHGVQRLGIKQGLDTNCVISPYSSFLTLPFEPQESMQNLERLSELGLEGRFGFYEAADFSVGRSVGGRYSVIRSFMAHHVGMSITACANALYEDCMQKRFMRDPSMRSAHELLQEKLAKDAVVYDKMKKYEVKKQSSKTAPPDEHSKISPQSPACAMLSNGILTHVAADTGTGFLRYSDTDITRRAEDPLMHAQGIFCFVRMNGETFSASAAPLYDGEAKRSCTFTENGISYCAQKGTTEIIQSFALDRALPVERCTFTVRNLSQTKSVASILFYLEPVLSHEREYSAHPAFSKLFVVGGREAATDTIAFSRRMRDGTDGIFLSVGLDKEYEYEYALKREELTPYPLGMEALLDFDSMNFTGGTATPDGCCAIKLSLFVAAKGETSVTMLLSCAGTREESVGNLVTARERGVNPSQAPLHGNSMTARLGARLLPKLLFPFPCDRTQSALLAENSQGQESLWTLGVSGDFPIVVYNWHSNPDSAVLEAYLRFWRLMRIHRLEFDLCVLDCPESTSVKLPAGVHRINAAESPQEVILLLKSAACHIVQTPESTENEKSEKKPFRIMRSIPAEASEIPTDSTRFDVVGGAFVGDRFYVNRVTPLPFSHVLATKSFGCLLQDSSIGNTWWRNSRECKISPWRGDIASGCDGEGLFLMSEGRMYDLCKGSRASFSETDALYEGDTGGINTSVRISLAHTGSIKYIDLNLENMGEEEAEVICAYAIEPVMGVDRSSSRFVKFDQYHGCLLMENPYQSELECHIAVRVPGEHPSYLTDRASFYAGDWTAQELIPNNDPIAGTIVRKRLPPRRRENIRFIIAAASGREAVLKLAASSIPSQYELGAEKSIETKRKIEISTPSEPLNRFINYFAPNQIRAGRLYGRCAFYQCSGAYGFRDQLQDAGAYLLLDPLLTKTQIARCCAAQFYEGDVLHWWHDLPKGMRGVRTRFSDDLAWLPFVVCDYVETVGDDGLLDLKIHYCKGEELMNDEQERYQRVIVDERAESVYDHSIKALERAFRLGDKGIPLIGCGDWNDGFSNVGSEGKGQSVWLGMFLSIVFDRFSSICEKRADPCRATAYKKNARTLRENIDRECWDGQWYLRAFFDDGEAIGGHKNKECRIDSLTQSFAVLCGMPDDKRTKSAIDIAVRRLVDEEHGIIKLFTPPFENEAHNPGYIKAYPAGIRENGGQYTHAAVWLALAMLKAGRNTEAWKLLDMMNPVSRCTQAKRAIEYKTEPYYMAADIYTNSGVYGHGGWSIYTGAAAWYYRTIISGLLGLKFTKEEIFLSPSLPDDWNNCTMNVKQENANIKITLKRTGKATLTVDGSPAEKIINDGLSHVIIQTF